MASAFDPPRSGSSFPPPDQSDASANAQALDALAAEVGIQVPALLRALVTRGATTYGPDWSEHWLTRCLTRPPAFISGEDFEWMSAQERWEAVHEWLYPGAQNGLRFLPFGQTGAGDAFCLVLCAAPDSEHAQAPVALVPHDDSEARVLHASFDDFAVAMLLQAMADIDHRLDDCTEQEAVAILRLDVAQVTACMSAPVGGQLQTWAAQSPSRHQVQHGQSARPARKNLALITPDQFAAGLSQLTPLAQGAQRFPVTPRWEVRGSTPRDAALLPLHQAPAPPSWQVLADDPAMRRQAIRAYQVAHGCDLREAKAAIDAHTSAVRANKENI